MPTSGRSAGRPAATTSGTRRSAPTGPRQTSRAAKPSWPSSARAGDGCRLSCNAGKPAATTRDGRPQARSPGRAGATPTHQEVGMEGLQGKVALVTGGSSGIGQAIAIRLGEEGVDVAINYVGRPEGAEETKDAIEHGVDICMKQMAASGTRPTLVAADVSSEDEVDAMFRTVLAEYGRLDFLINNAGIQVAADSDALSLEDFDRVLAVNLRGAFLCAQHAIRHFLADGHPGSIVNVSS